jgi:hypothetical protein
VRVRARNDGEANERFINQLRRTGERDGSSMRLLPEMPLPIYLATSHRASS